MALFDYTAINKKTGEKTTGSLEASSERQLRKVLREKNLLVLTIKDTSIHSKIKDIGKRPRGMRIKITELALLTRQLSTLLNAGLPIEEALRAISQQDDNKKIAKIVNAVRSGILEGKSLAKSMAEFPQSFPTLYRSTINAGEESGHLDNVLESLADYTESQYYMRQKIQQASIYPSLMVIVSIVIVTFLLVYIVPKMINVFQSTGHKLPTITNILIAISNFLQHYGFYMLLFLLFFSWLFRYFLKKNENFRENFQKFLLNMPLIGRMLKVINTGRFSKTFGILFAAGVPVIEAMQVAANVVSMLPIKHSLRNAADQVREGKPINKSLYETGYFPAMSIHLIASGENSGNLEYMLTRAATYQEKEVENTINTILGLFEPVMIITMGGVVLFIVMAILLPIFQMNQFVG